VKKYTRLLILTLLILTFFSLQSIAKRNHKEVWYQEKYCEGEMEVVLSDGSRVDCLTGSNAIEYDFANKWQEAGVQSLYYAMMTGQKAGIVLIIEKSKDFKYLNRLVKVIDTYYLPIDLFYIYRNNYLRYDFHNDRIKKGNLKK